MRDCVSSVVFAAAGTRGCQDRRAAAAKVLQKDGGHKAVGSCDAEAFLSDLLDDCHGGCPSAERGLCEEQGLSAKPKHFLSTKNK